MKKTLIMLLMLARQHRGPGPERTLQQIRERERRIDRGGVEGHVPHDAQHDRGQPEYQEDSVEDRPHQGAGV
jgi:hypothetical protein